MTIIFDNMREAIQGGFLVDGRDERGYHGKVYRNDEWVSARVNLI